ncbi:divalent-cation tolerance protein CutA [Phormidium sp. CCY1219]|uniref:divalent-cation tolerance protein CutA n=1 Tax=Phormidium sp. CCY1219 TaxID=2886104 RepID=UPI002D1EFAA3|nr:divalent-cation tolerance protein CutA [Phormidium sp. CCY1219]MEB3830989.1 divalent-cation tolerance protein CutA [Phormidium sp. CCY1219]
METNTDNVQYGIVLVTAESRESAEAIAEALVESHLAACVSLTPVRSIYTWQGEVNRDDEIQLIIKTDLQRFDALEAKVRQVHPYEVPEIIALPIHAGFAPYLQWISEQVQ